jgi:macrolide transport system ATP-binding/permease protein
MKRLRALMVRLAGLFGGVRREQELADEIDSHLEMHVEDNLRAGMMPEEARRQAMLQLGGVGESSKSIASEEPCRWWRVCWVICGLGFGSL